ncbi:MAG: hypothetical protein ABJ263_00570 [Tateyamaria sp.]|uniref:hypothetical protein n=1 Tax=Tateyamaria sp. TaxID=1929288 RepID=UPI00326939CB
MENTASPDPLAHPTCPDTFLRAVFPTYTALERPALSYPFKGTQPATPWPDVKAEAKHTHFSVGLFQWNTPEVARDKFRRRFERCTGVQTLLLDDVHEKAAPPKLEPTIKIETKAGSEQWLYLFAEPARELNAVAQMMQTLIDAGHADPGG